MLNLRPHHLFCIKKYIGKGYSDAFCLNMYRIIDSLNKEDFILVDHKDDVCKACPNLILGRCITARKVNKFDENAKKALNIEINKTYNIKDLDEKVTSIINDNEQFNNICPNCEWKDICHKKEE